MSLGMSGASISSFQASSRTCFDGQVTHEKTTVSSGLRCTASENEVSLPSGTSLPQQSTTLSAPRFLKARAALMACWRYSSRRAVGTAQTNPST